MKCLRILFVSLVISCAFIILYYNSRTKSPGENTRTHRNLMNDNVTYGAMVAEWSRDIQEYLRPYLRELEQIRDAFLDEKRWLLMDWTQISSTLPAYLNQFDRSYFNGTNRFGATIRTIVLRSPNDVLHRLYGSIPYYDYASTNCSRFHSEWSYDQDLGSRKCTENIRESLRPLSFTPLGALNVGLPYGTNTYGRAEALTLTYLHVVSPAYVTVVGDIFTTGVELMPQRCVQQTKARSPPMREISRPIQNEVFTISQHWGFEYYHFTVEDLPRLAPYIEFLKKHSHIKIHVFKPISFMKAALLRVGLSPTRIVSGHIRAKILYAPAGNPCMNSAMATARILTVLLQATLQPPPQVRNVIVLVRRTKKRYFINHDSIHKYLVDKARPLGLRVWVFPDDPPPNIAMMAAMFNSALMIVGPHGAGNSNMYYSRPGTVIVEGVCLTRPGFGNLAFRNLASVLGHIYYGIFLEEKSCFNLSALDVGRVVERYLEVIIESL